MLASLLAFSVAGVIRNDAEPKEDALVVVNDDLVGAESAYDRGYGGFGSQGFGQQSYGNQRPGVYSGYRGGGGYGAAGFGLGGYNGGFAPSGYGGGYGYRG